MIAFFSMGRDDWPAANELIARLLEDELQDLEPDDYEVLVAARCPPWKLLQDQEACTLVLRELLLMSRDKYEHRPSVLHQYVLYRCVRAWAEEAAQAIDIDSKSIANRTTHEQLSELLDGAFGEWEFSGGLQAPGVDAAGHTRYGIGEVEDARVPARIGGIGGRRPPLKTVCERYVNYTII